MYIYWRARRRSRFSSPHGDFSFSIVPLLFTFNIFCITVFVPSRGFLFFYGANVQMQYNGYIVFVPSRGFLFFYRDKPLSERNRSECFRPLTGISLFLWLIQNTLQNNKKRVFVPSRGFLFFYDVQKEYSKSNKFVFVPSRGFLFFYSFRSICK